MWHTALSLSHLISVQFGRSVVSDSLQLYGLQLLGSPVHHQLPELSQTHVYPVSDVIQSFCHLLPPFLLALNLSQHQDLFPTSWLFAPGGQNIEASALASVLPMNIQS